MDRPQGTAQTASRPVSGQGSRGQAVVVIGPDGTVMRSRPVTSRMVVGAPFSAVFGCGARRDGVPERLLRDATDRGRAAVGGPHLLARGHWAEIRVRCVRNGHGRIVQFVATVVERPDPHGAAPDDLDPVTAEVLFNRLSAILMTLRRVAQGAAAPVRADRVDAAIEELDAVIADLLRPRIGFA